MKKLGVLFTLFLEATLGTNALAHELPKPSLLEISKQLIVVTTPSWDASRGQLQPFARDNIHSPWHAVASPWDVVVGKTGLAWAADLRSYPLSGPIKKEGDNKSPAGAFSLDSVFGFAPIADETIKLPYIPVTDDTVCVDDFRSQYYGRIIDSAKVTKIDWSSAEQMSQYPVQYQEGIVVGYNTDGRIPKGGSCIFLHVRSPNSMGTAGCTAMAQNHVKTLSRWLTPSYHPVLVQLPVRQYQQLQKKWNLPSLK